MRIGTTPLISKRVCFDYQDESGSHRATMGIPFGRATACVFANVYLTELDREIDSIPGVHYFRYADDNPTSRKRAVVPKHNRDMPKGTRMSLLREAGHTRGPDRLPAQVSG